MLSNQNPKHLTLVFFFGFLVETTPVYSKTWYVTVLMLITSLILTSNSINKLYKQTKFFNLIKGFILKTKKQNPPSFKKDHEISTWHWLSMNCKNLLTEINSNVFIRCITLVNLRHKAQVVCYNKHYTLCENTSTSSNGKFYPPSISGSSNSKEAWWKGYVFEGS